MTCTPYNPALGLFYNTLTWGMTSQNPWSVTLITANGTNDPHDTVVIQKNGAEAARLTIRNPQTTRWIFFPKDFLAVRDVVAALAQIRGEDEESVREAVLQNAQRVFRL